MRELIQGQWLMMNGNTELVEEGQSHHPCYRMYKHDHSNIDGVNSWIRWCWERKYKLVLETQFVVGLVCANNSGPKQHFIDVNWFTVFFI